MEEVLGWVSNIQRFCIHDGDGIRTTVFLQGCALRCLWCCNPENLSEGPKLKYNASLCTVCGRCTAACPRGVLKMTDSGLSIAWEQCVGCGACAAVCLNHARSVCGVQVTAGAVLRQVVRDAAFYRKSGGGMTLSGGECLLQPDFAYALLRGAKERLIHPAAETCGFVEWRVFERVLPYTDLFLFDIKHTDPEAHRQLTGQSNERILDNLGRLAARGARIILRVPVVAGGNDSLDNLLAAARLAAQYQVERIELLPYHKLGVRKYEMLGRHYAGAAFQTPEPEDLAQKTTEMRKIFPDTVVKKM